jgi:hypothetical protein
MGPPHAIDQSVDGLSQKLTDHLNALLNGAPMVPVSSPLNGDAFDLFTISLRDSFCPHFRPLSQCFTLILNHA